MLSDRAQKAANQASRADWDVFFRALQNPYHPETNQDGFLVLNMAENNFLREKLNKQIKSGLESEPIPEWFNNYGPGNGHPQFLENIASMMRTTYLKGVEVDVGCVLTQQSVGSVIDSLAMSIGNPGDCVIIPTPCYMAFKWDLEARAEMTIQSAPCPDDYIPTYEILNKSYDVAQNRKSTPRALLITHPHNPTGILYTEEQLNVMVDFCEEKGIYLISDEIYGNSVFEGEDFISIAHVMQKRNPGKKKFMGDYVSIVSGLSKDWCMAGFRVGTFFCHNEKLFAVMSKFGGFQATAYPTQHVINCAFGDKEFVQMHVNENRRALKVAYDALDKCFQEVGGFKLVPAKGSIMVWVDCRALLPEPTFEYEEKLWQSLVDDEKILVATGKHCFSDIPGFLRITYMWPEVGKNGADFVIKNELTPRLKRWVAKWKQVHLKS